MKKILATLCAAMLCACCFGLAACGESSDEAKQFLGEWKLAAAEGEGVTFAGDFGAMFGDAEDITLKIDEGGTGSIAVGKTASDLTWEQADEENIAITVKAEVLSGMNVSGGKASEDKSETTITATYRDEMLALDLGNSDYNAKMIFTHDGTIPGLPELSAKNAQAVASADDLVGTWALQGVNMNGMLLYGDAKNLSTLVGGSDVSLTFEADGKANLMGLEATYTVDSTGASIEADTLKASLKMLDGALMVEIPSEIAGVDMVMRFGK